MSPPAEVRENTPSGQTAALAVVRALEVHSAVGRGRSRPLIVRAEDEHDYVIKLRATPKTARRLIAEVIAWQIAAALEIPQPPMALVTIDPDLPAIDLLAEKEEELRGSAGSVFGSRVIPKVTTLRRAADCPIAPDDAARIVWFDSLVMNIDRKWRNPNILVQGTDYWMIDNDSAFNLHHKWAERWRWPEYCYTPVSGRTWWSRVDHVLLPWASSIADAGDRLAPRVSESLIERALQQVPPEWYEQAFPDGSLIEPQLMYETTLTGRLRARRDFETLADAARMDGTCLERS
ncbi:MAG: hypothetical protein KF883_08935 [Thermomicrobiales bacterium]|nr:hypothetical protein [Thermomicrobiales bacterium]